MKKLLVGCSLLLLVGLPQTLEAQPPSKLTELRKRAQRLRIHVHRLLLQHHKHQLRLSKVQAKIHQLHVKQQHLLLAHHRLYAKVRAAQIRLMQTQLQITEARQALKRNRRLDRLQKEVKRLRALLAKKTNKGPAKKPKAAQATWTGYLASPKAPKSAGPRFAMQHPIVTGPPMPGQPRRRQVYFNVLKKGKFAFQAILLWAPGIKTPTALQRKLEITGTSRRISAGGKVGKRSYRGTVIRATAWKYVP